MATLEPVTGTTKTGENVAMRCAEASDAPPLIALMSGIIAEGVYTLATSGQYLDSIVMYRFVKPDDHETRTRLPMAAHE